MNSSQNNNIKYYKLNNKVDIRYFNNDFWLINKTIKAKEYLPFNLQLKLIKYKPTWLIFLDNPSFVLCYQALLNNPNNIMYMNILWDCFKEIEEIHKFMTNY